ncbi:MAG: NUDIX domain-containing protein [Gemmatimonadota bacterium]
MDFPRHIVAVAGLVTDPAGNVLLVENRHRGWEFPGGQVEVGETVIGALEREVREEAGVTCRVNRLVGVYSNIKKQVPFGPVSEVGTILMLDFLCDYVSGQLVSGSEHARAAWVPRAEVLDRIAATFIRDRMEVMLSFAGEVTYRAYSKDPYVVHLERSI